MQKRIGLVIVIALAAAVVIGGVFVYRNTLKSHQVAGRAQIHSVLVEHLDDFHRNIRTLSASATGSEAQEELRKMKEYAGFARDKIHSLDVKTSSLNGFEVVPLREAIAKVDKYLAGYEDLANLSISQESLKAKAEAALESLEEFRRASNLFGSPDKGDIAEAISRGTKLAKNLSKGPQLKRPTVIVASPYWSNPVYAGYHEAIQGIVASYSAGRKTLSRVLTHYDAGVFSDRDITDWQRELNRRRELLRQLDNIAGMMPPGSIYERHHTLLRSMLESAIEAMERFANSQNVATRKYLSAVSRSNTAIMNQLKRFYGIR